MNDNSVTQPADEYAAERAAYVAGLRELADWWETHTEIAPTAYPRVSHSVTYAGLALTGGDAEGIARVEAMAEALGVAADTESDSHPCAERLFGPIEFAAVYVRERSAAEYRDDLALLKETKAARAAAANEDAGEPVWATTRRRGLGFHQFDSSVTTICGRNTESFTSWRGPRVEAEVYGLVPCEGCFGTTTSAGAVAS